MTLTMLEYFILWIRTVKTLKAAAYARVSTKEQSKTSIEGQLETVRKFAEMNDFEIIDEFFDKDHGNNMNRENFTKMLEKAYAGKYDAIIVEKIDRFAREDLEPSIIIRKLEEYGCMVISALEPADVSTPSGRFQRWIMLGFAKMEREMISDRTKRRMRDIAKKGFWMGGAPPYGYRLKKLKDKEDGNRERTVIEIDENEAAVIRSIFKLHAEGNSLSYICRYLQNSEIKNRKGNYFPSSSIYDILCNKKYVGIYEYGKGTKTIRRKKNSDPVCINIPSIIDKTVWEESKKRFKNFTCSNKTNIYLLRGKIFCGICGSNMSGTGGKYPAYACSDWKNHRKGAVYNGVNKIKVEKEVFLRLKHELVDNKPDFKRLSETFNYTNALQNAVKDDRLNKSIGELTDLKEQEKRIVEAIKKGIISAEMETEAKEVQNKIKILQDRIILIKSSALMAVNAEDIERSWNELIEKLLSNNEKNLRELYAMLLHKIIVERDGYIKILLNDISENTLN